tara:strand:+ start:296 stop:739 length:444 start_codon:yes stop_codon:yes gene_type:complete
LKFQSVQLGIHVEFVIRQPYDDVGFYCPICASFFGEYHAYDSDGNPSYDLICPDCKFQPGCDDDSFSDWKLSFDDYLMAYRINWLDGAQSNKDYLARLERVLGIDESKLREREDELRAEWKRCWNNHKARNRLDAINRAKTHKPGSD